jgi:pimeloyl-ACP methyl ester carboxylesterase
MPIVFLLLGVAVVYSSARAEEQNRVSYRTVTVDGVELFYREAGNQDIQLQMFYSYGTNPPLYPAWQEYLREHQPPTLIIWGQNDEIFPAAGAEPYKRDLKELEYHLIDTGHFALESHGQEIADLIRDFLNRKVVDGRVAANQNVRRTRQ